MTATPYSPRLGRLIETLRRLPSVGPKSAQRMALHLLQRDREGAVALAHAVHEALTGIERCPKTRMFCEPAHCRFCSDARAASGQLCVVENPADLIAIENSTAYKGRWFVLGGRLSPLDGIGPQALGLDALSAQLADGSVRELIIATNPTVEGEATAHYIAELAKAQGVAVSRIAHGVPMGGELEYVDGGTLNHAFAGRRAV